MFKHRCHFARLFADGDGFDKRGIDFDSCPIVANALESDDPFYYFNRCLFKKLFDHFRGEGDT